ncbi:MAG TPA: IS607 family element RNA-guided endonuclease TnpB [Streptosporangiaceae bacterium]|nr:IS607 family element RNA-guided endonuclease TnpB [Streptosporangiaceae bacterium]
MTLLAYRFALDPAPAQERALRSHAGAARVAFNWGLGRVKANLGQREAEKSYGITGDDLTPSISWSLYSLRKEWNAAKDEVAPWWGECSKEAFSTGLDGLARALKNWGNSRKGKRKGSAAGFPRFRSKRKARPSVRWTTGSFRCEARHAVLPRIGRVKLHESGARLAGLVTAGTARVLSVTVRYERGRWFAAFTAETGISRPAPRRPDAVAGIDLGIKTLAVLSTGEEIPSPRHMSGALRKLRRLSRAISRRQGPDRRTRREPSNRWRRASAALGKAQGRVADQRKDGLHKLTTRLTSEFGTVVIEDLHVAGMVRNHRLARHVADASFGEFRRQAEYKAAWHGGRVIIADRWFASSKTCSGCGAVKAKLPLSERTYACTSCGLVADRDVNAARNLAALGRRELAGSGPDSNGRGADRKTGLARRVAVKRQPGTRQRGQTGTAAPQGTAAA